MPVILAVTLITLNLAPVSASSANISHSYKADSGAPNGSLVALDSQRSDYVQPANTNNAVRLVGVAVADNDSLLAVDAGRSAVQVATSGSVSALVSTMNGDIHAGDRISVSPFNGVGMKSAPGAEILGLAQTTLDDTTGGTVTRTIADKSGKDMPVRVGLVRVNIAIAPNPAVQGSDSGLTGPQKVAKLLTGREISTVRAIVSLVVVIVALMALVTLIYASIYGSIIAVGRNPLAKYAIFRTLTSVLIMAALTAAVAGAILFLLLR